MSENKKINIILIRHAKSVHRNSTGAIFASSRIDTGITEKGFLETKQFATELIGNRGIDLILSSNLKRSKQTADIVVKEILQQTEKSFTQ